MICSCSHFNLLFQAILSKLSSVDCRVSVILTGVNLAPINSPCLFGPVLI